MYVTNQQSQTFQEQGSFVQEVVEGDEEEGDHEREVTDKEHEEQEDTTLSGRLCGRLEAFDGGVGPGRGVRAGGGGDHVTGGGNNACSPAKNDR